MSPVHHHKEKAMPAKTSKITDTQIQTALDRWLKGEGRTALIADLKLPLTRGELAQRFRDLTEKTWAELNDMRKGGRPKPVKVAKKAKPEPTSTKGKKDKGVTEASDAPQARRRAA
jgi:hypothetical protein